MTMKTKQEIIEDTLPEYLNAKTRKEKSVILNRLVTTTHMHRKAVIRRLRVVQKTNTTYDTAQVGRGRDVYYTSDVTAALKDVWEAGGEVCGDLLHPMICEYVTILRKDDMWTHSDEATSKLCAVSEGTVRNRVGKFLKARRKGKGISATSPSQIKHIIPIFHGDWSKKPTGTCQIDTVVHCGHTLSGDLVYTLNVTDIPTLWVTTRAQWNKGQIATQESLKWIMEHTVWHLIEVHPDTGSEFINWHLKSWCDIQSIAMSRSRPYHKNDNMTVEERNGHVVRKWIGYMRFDREDIVPLLNDVYEVLNVYLNHFVASKRVLEKIEIQGKWKKKYEKVAKTPYQRVLLRDDVSDEVKNELKKIHESLNPSILITEIARRKTIMYDRQRTHGETEKLS